MVLLSFALSVILLAFLWERLRRQSVLAVGRHLSTHTCADDASIAITWAAHVTKDFYQKRTEQVPIKRFLKEIHPM